MSLTVIRMSLYLLLTLVFIGGRTASGQTTWFVDDSSTNGTNSGMDWTNAFVELQSALMVATNGDEIKVAQGVYRPDYDVSSGVHNGNRSASFGLVDGVQMYGGYAGWPSVDPDLRNIEEYKTILSGDLARDDNEGTTNNSENSYCVVVGESVGSNGLMDGFTISGGNNDQGSGGGLYLYSSSLRLAQCVFENNTALTAGGGIYVRDQSDPTVTSCKVFRCSAGVGGGAYFLNSRSTMANCVFIENEALGQYGKGGGVCNSWSESTYTNCAFVRNWARSRGAGMNNSTHAHVTVANSVFWQNADWSGFTEQAQINTENYSSLSTSYCCIQGLDALVGEGNIDDDPKLTRDGIHLQINSPCIDAGDPAGNIAWTTDFDGEPRIDGGRVDIGPDEFTDSDADGLPNWWEERYFDSTTGALPNGDPDDDGIDNTEEYANCSDPLVVPGVLYVSILGDDSWDGLAEVWDGVHGPKATIQAGIDATGTDSGDTVIVLPGTYSGPGNRDLDYGGRAITVRSSEPANPSVVGQTVIDCGGSSAEPHRCAWFGSGEMSQSVLSGFTIQGGYAEYGGGVYCLLSSPTISHCVFSGNSAYEGGGLYSENNGNPTVANCVFQSNSATNRAGGIHLYASAAYFSNCTINRNSGGGIHVENSTPMLLNCTVSDNLGVGVYNFSHATTTLQNCVLWGNASSDGKVETTQVRIGVGITVIMSNCCVLGLDHFAGNNNIGEDPLLTPDGLHLRAGSPCIDQGAPGLDYTGQVDLDGEPRQVGVAVDMGSDEFVDTDGDGLPDWWEEEYFGSSTSALANENPDGDDRDNLAEYAENSDPFSGPLVYYVSVSGDDSWDGMSSEWDGVHGPKATIQAGIDGTRQYEGDTIVVLPGTYTGPGNRDIDFKAKAITVRSSDPTDPSVVTQTIVSCEGSEEEPHVGFRFRLLEGPDSVLDGITIEGGYAESGGGVRCWNSSPTLSNLMLRENSAVEGGGLHVRAGSPRLTNCVFSGNSAEDGGGLYGYLCDSTITGCRFEENWLRVYNATGGGIHIAPGHPTLMDCEFLGNRADEQNSSGGGASVGGSSEFIRCIFRDNSATENYSDGGAMNIFGDAIRLSGCIFQNNQADTRGGAIYTFGTDTVTIENCVFDGNAVLASSGGTGGGAICSERCDPVITNCLLTRNSSTYNGGAVYNESMSSPVITNCILWGNSRRRGFDEKGQIQDGDEGYTSTVQYCCVQGLDEFSGNGNIGDDPLLTLDGWHLRGSSPCINQGDPEGDYSGQVDGDGEGRVFGDRVDIGLDEFWDSDQDGLPDWWEEKHFGDTTAAAADGDPDTDDLNNIVEYNENTDPLNAPYSFYVSVSGSDSWDGLSSEWDGEHGPKATIQVAIDLADSYRGDTVVVLPGTYSGIGNRDLDFRGKAIAVRSSDPADLEIVAQTVIDCEGTTEEPHRGIWFHSFEGPNSILSGLTIRGGHCDSGGGVLCTLSNPTLLYCVLVDNRADADGGGLLLDGSNSVVRQCRFEGNSAKTNGGGLCNTVGSPTLIDCDFRGNAAHAGSGMFHELSAGMTVARCTFVENGSADNNTYGGGMYIVNGAATVSQCVFEDNLCSMTGGGAYFPPSCPVLLDECVFRGNTVTGHAGGGLYIAGNDKLVTNCRFIGNTSAGDGGGAYCGSGSTVFANCVFRANSARTGGGILQFRGTPTMVHCTFVGNAASYRGGGVYNEESTSSFTNCIFWGNFDRDGRGEEGQIRNYNSTSVSNPAYCCIQGLSTYAGNGNIASDPMMTANGMHLCSGSPCIDGGEARSGYSIEFDIDGEPRVTGISADMGADEYIDTDSDGLPDWWEERHFGMSTGAIPGNDDDSDGRDNTSEYANNSNPFRESLVRYVSVSGDDSWNGLSSAWDGERGPKATIQAGIDASDSWEGDSVVVLAGVYLGEGNRDLSYRGKKVTVRSADPTDPVVVGQTIIDCEGSDTDPHRGVLFTVLDGPDAILSGLTISGGDAENGGGVYCINSSPTITNCVFSGNSAVDGGGMDNIGSSPRIASCIFRDNTADSHGGGMGNSYNSSLNAESCEFSGNSAVYGGGVYIYSACNMTLTGCTIMGNTASRSGGGVYGNHSDISLVACNLHGNAADEHSTTYGGGAYIEACIAVLTNCAFRANNASGSSSGYGGGVYTEDSKTDLANCTLSGNRAKSYGGGVRQTGSDYVEFVNSILWGNADRGGYDESGQVHGSSVELASCCVQGLNTHAGDGNIGDDPQFADTNGLDGIAGTKDDDIRLLAGSPCIDAGDNKKIPFGVHTDIEGLARVSDCQVDMGAHEYQANTLFGDADYNCVVDLSDYVEFQACLEWPVSDATSIPELCRIVFDGNDDGSVDLRDFAEFQRVFAEIRK